MGSHGTDAAGTHLHEHVGGLGNRSARIYHIVQQDDVTVLHLADGYHLRHLVGLVAVFVAYHERSVEVRGVTVGPLGPAYVRSGYRQVLQTERLDVRHENTAGIDVIERHVEKALYLVCMQVHGDDTVHACRHKQIGHQLGAYRYARTVLAVLTGPAEVGNHGDNLIRRRPLGRIYHQQELHEVLGGRRSGLYDENSTSADTLLERGLEFAVAEPADRQVAQFASVTLGNLRGQFVRTAARKDFQFVNSHQCKLLRDFVLCVTFPQR